jgi:hypothetical protein
MAITRCVSWFVVPTNQKPDTLLKETIENFKVLVAENRRNLSTLSFISFSPLFRRHLSKNRYRSFDIKYGIVFRKNYS